MLRLPPHRASRSRRKPPRDTRSQRRAPLEGANGSCVHREADPVRFLCRSNGAGNGARPDAKTRRYDRQLRYVLAAGRPSAVRRSER
jgi:hypothetical protein